MSARDPWLGVGLRHLEALAALAAEQSFSGAADRLGYVQSAVSQQIAFLERLCGVRLVVRGNGSRGVRLTAAGGVMLVHAEAILTRLGSARQELAGLRAPLRLGVTPAFSELARRPAPEAETTVAGDAALVRDVRAGVLDAGIAGGPVPGGFGADELPADEYVLVVPADSPLAGRARAARADLAALDVLAHGPGLPALSVAPRVVYESGDAAALQALVAAGAGAAIVPRLEVDPPWARTAVLELGDLVPRRRFTLFWRADAPAPPGLRRWARAACATGASKLS